MEGVMTSRTAFLSRLIGLYCILVSLYMVTHKEVTVEMVTALTHSQPALFAVGLMAATIGLATILGHNVWSGGALPVVVTLVGWTALFKGLLCMFLSPEAASEVFLGWWRYEQLYYVYASLSFLLGIYLTYGGLRSTALVGRPK
jgi:hypothetical protein